MAAEMYQALVIDTNVETNHAQTYAETLNIHTSEEFHFKAFYSQDVKYARVKQDFDGSDAIILVFRCSRFDMYISKVICNYRKTFPDVKLIAVVINSMAKQHDPGMIHGVNLFVVDELVPEYGVNFDTQTMHAITKVIQSFRQTKSTYFSYSETEIIKTTLSKEQDCLAKLRQEYEAEIKVIEKRRAETVERMIEIQSVLNKLK